MMKTANWKIADGRHSLEAYMVRCGADISLAVCGGSGYHIGAVALGIPRPSLKEDGSISASASVFCVTGHKEDELARLAAIHLASQYNVTVCVSVGIHMDKATPTDTGKICENFNRLLDQIPMEGI